VSPIARHMIGDLLRALSVLALVFLSFAHQPVAVSVAAPLSVAALSDSYCGEHPAAPSEKSHPRCEACRIGAGFDLVPPAPALAAPHSILSVCGPIPVALGLGPAPRNALGPRGPPRLV
jgi:hypothetical protein